MFKEAILTFVCFILFVKGKPNLIFLEGSEKLVSSIQIIRNGTNFTVTCVIEDLKSKTKPLDLIFWTNCDLSTKRREVHSITLCTPGSYCCISDKYKLIKRFHLIVRDGHDFVRRKRSEYQFSNQYRNAISDLNHFGTLDSPVTIPSVLRDLFDGPSKKASNKNQNIYIHDDDLYMSNSGGNVITNNNNYHTNYGGNNVLTSYPESKYIESPPPIHVSEHKDDSNNIYIYVYIIYSIAIVLAFAIVGFLIYCCMSKKRGAPVHHVPINNNVNTNNTNNQGEYYCNHGFCVRNRRAHTDINTAPNCYLPVLTPNDSIPLTTFQSGDDGGVTILTNLIRNDGTDGNPARPYSDSPPAYGISSRNSPLLLREDVPNQIDVPPPSYNQAVAQMNVDPPPDFDFSVNQTLLATTSASSPNVVHVRTPLRTPVVNPEI